MLLVRQGAALAHKLAHALRPCACDSQANPLRGAPCISYLPFAACALRTAQRRGLQPRALQQREPVLRAQAEAAARCEVFGHLPLILPDARADHHHGQHVVEVGAAAARRLGRALLGDGVADRFSRTHDPLGERERNP